MSLDDAGHRNESLKPQSRVEEWMKDIVKQAEKKHSPKSLNLLMCFLILGHYLESLIVGIMASFFWS